MAKLPWYLKADKTPRKENGKMTFYVNVNRWYLLYVVARKIFKKE